MGSGPHPGSIRTKCCRRSLRRLHSFATATGSIPSPARRSPKPSASDVGALFSSARTVLEIVGPGGAGKTTLARQVGRWGASGGPPRRVSGHAMMPVWIDEDLDPVNNALAKSLRRNSLRSSRGGSRR